MAGSLQCVVSSGGSTCGPSAQSLNFAADEAPPASSVEVGRDAIATSSEMGPASKFSVVAEETCSTAATGVSSVSTPHPTGVEPLCAVSSLSVLPEPASGSESAQPLFKPSTDLQEHSFSSCLARLCAAFPNPLPARRPGILQR